MQEADEQTEGNNKKKKKSGAQEESWSAERGRELGLCCPWMLGSVNSKELAWASFWDLKLLIFWSA